MGTSQIQSDEVRRPEHSNGDSRCERTRCERPPRGFSTRAGRSSEKLRKRLDASQRAGKRQAAPFSKRDPEKDPKQPGRKFGREYGKRASRARPEKGDDIVDVPLDQKLAL